MLDGSLATLHRAGAVSDGGLCTEPVPVSDGGWLGSGRPAPSADVGRQSGPSENRCRPPGNTTNTVQPTDGRRGGHGAAPPAPPALQSPPLPSLYHRQTHTHAYLQLYHRTDIDIHTGTHSYTIGLTCEKLTAKISEILTQAPEEFPRYRYIRCLHVRMFLIHRCSTQKKITQV